MSSPSRTLARAIAWGGREEEGGREREGGRREMLCTVHQNQDKLYDAREKITFHS